jgi:hypothetical protein
VFDIGEAGEIRSPAIIIKKGERIMPQIKVGLAPGKTSFYDPKTNTYITLDQPVQTITFNEQTDLSGICHALFVQRPALVLYEGKLPQDAVEQWKTKYDLKGLMMAKNRADHIQNQSADVVSQQVKQAEMISMQSVESQDENMNQEHKEEKKSTRKRKTKNEQE